MMLMRRSVLDQVTKRWMSREATDALTLFKGSKKEDLVGSISLEKYNGIARAAQQVKCLEKYCKKKLFNSLSDDEQLADLIMLLYFSNLFERSEIERRACLERPSLSLQEKHIDAIVDLGRSVTRGSVEHVKRWFTGHTACAAVRGSLTKIVTSNYFTRFPLQDQFLRSWGNIASKYIIDDIEYKISDEQTRLQKVLAELVHKRLLQLAYTEHTALVDSKQIFGPIADDELVSFLHAIHVNKSGPLDFFRTLVSSRPPESMFLSHKQALTDCVEHARLWLLNSELPISYGVDITYADLRRAAVSTTCPSNICGASKQVHLTKEFEDASAAEKRLTKNWPLLKWINSHSEVLPSCHGKLLRTYTLAKQERCKGKAKKSVKLVHILPSDFPPQLSKRKGPAFEKDLRVIRMMRFPLAMDLSKTASYYITPEFIEDAKAILPDIKNEEPGVKVELLKAYESINQLEPTSQELLGQVRKTLGIGGGGGGHGVLIPQQDPQQPPPVVLA